MTELHELPLEDQMRYLEAVLDDFENKIHNVNDFGTFCFKLGEMKSTLYTAMFNLRNKLQEERKNA